MRSLLTVAVLLLSSGGTSAASKAWSFTGDDLPTQKTGGGYSVGMEEFEQWLKKWGGPAGLVVGKNVPNPFANTYYTHFLAPSGYMKLDDGAYFVTGTYPTFDAEEYDYKKVQVSYIVPGSKIFGSPEAKKVNGLCPSCGIGGSCGEKGCPVNGGPGCSCTARAAMKVAPAPVNQVTIKRAPVGHTHTCARGHTWDHTMDNGSHLCPHVDQYGNRCGLKQTTQDPTPRMVTTSVPAAQVPVQSVPYYTQSYSLPGSTVIQGGGCSNGSCSTGTTRSGIFNRR